MPRLRARDAKLCKRADDDQHNMHSAYPSFVPSRSIIGPEIPLLRVYASRNAKTTREYSTLLMWNCSQARAPPLKAPADRDS